MPRRKFEIFQRIFEAVHLHFDPLPTRPIEQPELRNLGIKCEIQFELAESGTIIFLLSFVIIVRHLWLSNDRHILVFVGFITKQLCLGVIARHHLIDLKQFLAEGPDRIILDFRWKLLSIIAERHLEERPRLQCLVIFSSSWNTISLRQEIRRLNQQFLVLVINECLLL